MKREEIGRLYSEGYEELEEAEDELFKIQRLEDEGKGVCGLKRRATEFLHRTIENTTKPIRRRKRHIPQERK